MCMLMTINPNVGHVTTSSESSFVLFPLLQNDTLTIGQRFRDHFALVLHPAAMHVFGLSSDWSPGMYDVFVHLLSIESRDDCQMP